jgi:hypothetical protein
MEGDFRVTSNIVVDDNSAHLNSEAATIHVEPADYFQTGSIVSAGRQGVYIAQSWTTEINTHPSAGSQ